jgi:formate/nitrite transporter
MLNAQELTEAYIAASPDKAGSSMWRLLWLGVAAGIFIGLGAVTASTAAQAVSNIGMQRLVSGALFPIGLCMVVLLGAELFTGNALMVTAAMRGKITWPALLRNWGIVYIGNLLGAVLLAYLMANFGQLDIGAQGLAVYSARVAAAKVSLTWLKAFVLGIFCNLLVCAAIYMGMSAKDTAGKILGSYLPILAFVTSGFEHCVADMYYVPAGIFARGNPEYAQVLLASGLDVSGLTWGGFVLHTLIPISLGNIAGGVLLGILMYYAHAVKKE